MSPSEHKRESGGQKGVVLFADLCDSTKLYEDLGDETALNLVKRFFLKCEDIGRKYGGTLVKTIGDELMFYFPSQFGALSAATEFQTLTKDYSMNAGKELRLRVGLNAGELQHENGDVFGDTVNIAARFVAFAAPGSIITSMATCSDIDCSRHFVSRCIGMHKFKGKSEPIECCEVLWDFEQSVTIMHTSDAGFHLCKLSLEYGDESVEIDEWGRASIGRTVENTIQVDWPCVSRRHAVIEWRSAAFYLIDQSTNGTFVKKADSPAVQVCHQAYSLSGVGTLIFGQADDTENRTTVSFKVLY
jgi:adenylate cyclase